MKISKAAVTVGLVGLFIANYAFALPGFSSEAPQQSVDNCIAQIAANADYDKAGSVVHNVETEDRRVSGHTMNIRTLVFDTSGEDVIREYAARCASNDNAEIKYFKIRQKGS